MKIEKQYTPSHSIRLTVDFDPYETEHMYKTIYDNLQKVLKEALESIVTDYAIKIINQLEKGK